MRATKYMAATRRRWSALIEQRNRGLDLIWQKRSRLNDHTTSRRHIKQYLTNARRCGWLAPTKEWRDL